MGLKIYREINNNTIDNQDNNILLEFICNINLYDVTDIFDCCLHYDEEHDEYITVSEVYHERLKDCLDYLRSKIEYSNNNIGTIFAQDNAWLQEAQRCYEILSNELNNRTSEYYMLLMQ